jgi:cell division protein FtsW
VNNIANQPRIRRKREPLFKIGQTDITLIFAIIFLIVFGIVMIYSASYYASYVLTDQVSHTLFLEKQLVWSVISIITMIIVSFINFRVIAKFWLLIYIANLVFLFLVLFQEQDAMVNGASRWFKVGGIGFQPSEFAKLAMIITLAVSVNETRHHLARAKALLINLILVGLPIGLVMKEDLSTGVVMLCIGIAMLFIAIPKWKAVFKYIAYVGAAIIFAVLIFKDFILYLLEDYQLVRFRIFFEGPWSEPLDSGYQTIQSLYAIGSGGLFGKGLGYSMQKNGFIPEAHNDIIYAIICEELGYFGAIAVVILFTIIIWRCVVIVVSSKDTLGMLIVTGVLTQIAIQVIINIAVVTNTMPATGMPLPFISYGGSSLFFLMIEIGMVLNIARQRNE